MNPRKIVIEPVTRVEGHGKVTIKLDENGKVSDAFLHIVEFRGFEKFIQGHPYWEAPVLVIILLTLFGLLGYYIGKNTYDNPKTLASFEDLRKAIANAKRENKGEDPKYLEDDQQVKS